jgi:hypothetical protein
LIAKAATTLSMSRSEMSRLSKDVAAVKRLLSNQDKVQYEAQAFKFGDLRGNFTDLTPLA